MNRLHIAPQRGTQRRSLRVLLVLTEFPPSIGGMQTHAIHLSRHLWKLGHRVEVVTYQSVSREAAARAEEVDSALPFAVHRVLSRLGHFHNLELLEELGLRFEPDLVYCSTVFYGGLGRRLGIPVVCRSVGNDVLRPWIVFPFRPLSRLVSTRWFESWLYRYFRRLDYPELIESLLRRRRRELMVESARAMQGILANSDFTAGLLRDIGVSEERISVVTGGVDSRNFERSSVERAAERGALRRSLGIPSERFVVLTACRFERKKGLDFLISAMPALVARMPDLHLMIVGDGRRYRKLEALAQCSPVVDRISLVGRVAHDQIAPYYAASDLFVLASRIQRDPLTGLSDAETMGRVLCEANAAGIPALASQSGGIPSVITDGENGLLFRPDDLGDFLRCVRRVRADAALVRALVECGQRRARESFDWDQLVARHEGFFLECVSQRGTTAHSGVEAVPRVAAPLDELAL